MFMMTVRRIQNKSIKIGWKNLDSADLSVPFWRTGAVLFTLEKSSEVNWYITGFSCFRNVVTSPTSMHSEGPQNSCDIIDTCFQGNGESNCYIFGVLSASVHELQ